MKSAIPWLTLGGFVLLGIFLSVAGPFSTAPVQGDVGSGKKDPDAQTQIKELQAEIKKLQQMVPDQAAVMTHVGYHFSNLWFAIDQENWILADFYLSETRANLKWAVRVKPVRKIGSEIVLLDKIAEALDNTQFTQLKNAIAQKDKKLCIKLYDDTLIGCYACHKASDKSFLHVHTPTAPETRMINFDPKAKGP